MDFMECILAKARDNKKTIVLPESNDRRVLEAASTAAREGIAHIIVIGDKDGATADFPDLDLNQVIFMDPCAYEGIDTMAFALYELRKHKGMAPEEAKRLVQLPTYFGMMLVKLALADGLVAGAVNTTADTLRPALQILKTKPGASLVSAYLLLIVPECNMGNQGMLLMADCALNVDPTDAELADIAIASAESWRQLTGEEARVAMLSFSSLGSGSGTSPDKVASATRIAKEKAPQLVIDGELQADAALVPVVAHLKAPNSEVAGRANCLIFPDLNAGNIGYKLVERLAKAQAYGPMLQGLARPVNDLSRGCSASDIVGVIALTAVQAMEFD